MSTVLRDTRKGKTKTTLTFKEDGKVKKETVYVSHLNVKITANKQPVRIVLVYGLRKTPMMLATNRTLQSKEDVIRVVRDYMSHWRIEEYSRFKKQHFVHMEADDFSRSEIPDKANLHSLEYM